MELEVFLEKYEKIGIVWQLVKEREGPSIGTVNTRS